MSLMSGVGDDAPRVLLIDDDENVGRLVSRVLGAKGMTVTHLRQPAEIEELIAGGGAATEPWDAIVLDVHIGDLNGLDVLAQLQEGGNRTAVVMLTSDESAMTATTALRGGAFHYIVKSQVTVQLPEGVSQAVRHTRMHRALLEGTTSGGGGGGRGADVPSTSVLVGTSSAMTELRRMIPRIGGSNVSVLIAGESGTGKEVVARALHEASPRVRKPFVPINCGAIPEGLIDSELFGHTKGAFTGATTARPGVFVEADGGTLFLDEIGDMPLAVQARLLRALQEGEVRAVGADGVRAVDVRVLAATNVDLARAVQEGRFRADLYFRLNVVNVRIPALRDRDGDIPALTAAMIRRHAPEPRPSVTEAALNALEAYQWPGNVRELENAVLHALAMSKDGVIDTTELPPAIVAASARPRLALGSSVTTGPIFDPDVPLTEAKRKAASEFEKSYLLRILEQSKGSISGASRLAGIDRTNFRRLLQRHGIDSSKFKS
jgi:DNA-binding NtrC family response regulator